MMSIDFLRPDNESEEHSNCSANSSKAQKKKTWFNQMSGEARLRFSLILLALSGSVSTGYMLSTSNKSTEWKDLQALIESYEHSESSHTTPYKTASNLLIIARSAEKAAKGKPLSKSFKQYEKLASRAKEVATFMLQDLRTPSDFPGVSESQRDYVEKMRAMPFAAIEKARSLGDAFDFTLDDAGYSTEAETAMWNQGLKKCIDIWEKKEKPYNVPFFYQSDYFSAFCKNAANLIDNPADFPQLFAENGIELDSESMEKAQKEIANMMHLQDSDLALRN